MSSHIDISHENRHLGELSRFFAPLLAIGVIALGIVLFMGLTADTAAAKQHFYQGYLVNFLFYLAISLGALFFVLLHHLTHAGWSASLRRVSEGMACSLPWLALLFLPILLGLFDHQLFIWADAELAAEDPLLRGKAAYLNPTFFIIRAAIYFTIWTFLSRRFFSKSVKQDESGDVQITHGLQKLSAPGMILFALTLTFAAFDWIMSLDPHFFSTIFGVYFFAGCVCSFMAATVLIVLFLQNVGRLRIAVTTEHMHDLGKLMFAFGMVFWAYIAYSQYMLIWYANVPEETGWFQARTSTQTQPAITLVSEQLGIGEFTPGGWNNWSIFLLVGHFAVPFVFFVSRIPKRRGPLLMVGAIWMLFMCWFDLYWLVMPIFHPEGAVFDAVYDLLPAVGMGAILLALLINRFQSTSLIAEKDPRLLESIAFENM